MKLKDKSTHLTHYYGYRCELTTELDRLRGWSEQKTYHHTYHYIVADEWCKSRQCLAIRVPGRTVGGIWIDNKNVITKIVIDDDSFFR